MIQVQKYDSSTLNINHFQMNHSFFLVGETDGGFQ
jgi:hypothetical protein